MKAARSVVVLLVLLPLTGCGGGAPIASAPPPLTVFAAASLTESLTDLARAYQLAVPGTSVRTSFAGSPSLVAQIRQGARVDLAVTADLATMDALADQLDGPPQVLARNSLAIITGPGNPKQIRTLTDLGRPGVTVVLAGPTVPAGKVARAALTQARVVVRPVSEEADVKAVLTKVRLGEADAGIVYLTDLVAAKGAVEGTPLPGAVTSYPAAVLRDSAQPQQARRLLEFLLAPDGQRVLASYGFLPPT